MNSFFILLLLSLFSISIVFFVIRGFICSRNQNLVFLRRDISDTLKGISILMIMFAHIVQQFGERIEFVIPGGSLLRYIVFSWGAVGVGIFFFLSGYGNTASLYALYSRKVQQGMTFGESSCWLWKRVLRLMFSFLCSFFVVVIVLNIFSVGNYSYSQLWIDLVNLRIPFCSTWYLKIQLLFYILIFLSFVLLLNNREDLLNKKSGKIIFLSTLSLMVLLYVFFAIVCLKLDDYWWKTSLCFVFGSLLFL